MNLRFQAFGFLVALSMVFSAHAIAAADSIPEKLVVLTFDDASASHATFVAPLLKKYGFGATFFVCEFPPDFDTAKDKYMTWEQIAGLHQMGFEIGNHTRSHRHVNRMSADEFITELSYIEGRCAAHGITRPASFAYPAYVSTPQAMAILKQRGYEWARVGGSAAFDPAQDDALTVPSFSTTGGKFETISTALRQAREGKVVVLTSHGVPDLAHPHVTTPPEAFERYLQFLRDEKYTVIAMRDLAKYLPPPSKVVAGGSAKPTLYLIGDSTVKNGTAGLQGWGSALGSWLDPAKITLTNAALGGRSSRSFLREGLWEKVNAQLKPGDFVIMQFGHNDGGPIDEGKARASLKGNGEEARLVTIKETGIEEAVHSYGWYLRRYTADTRAKGATPIVVSPVPRNIWKGGRVLRNDTDYGKWAVEAARQGGAIFLDLNALIADRYDVEGQATVSTRYFTATDHTHTTAAGAELNAEVLAEALRGLRDSPLPAMFRAGAAASAR